MEIILDWQLQSQIVERVKDDADLAAYRTGQRGFVHACEEIRDDRITTLLVYFPASICHIVQGHGIMDHFVSGVRFFNVWFLENTVEIFLETVQQEEKEFLRILLLVAGERWTIFANDVLEVPWRERLIRTSVHRIEQLAIGFRDVPAVTKRITGIQLLLMTILCE